MSKYLIDTFIALVFLSSAYSWSSAIKKQNLYREDAKQIISFLHSTSRREIAIPEEMRKEVISMLKAEVRPVLYDPRTVSPQFFSRLNTNYVYLPKKSNYVDDTRVLKYLSPVLSLAHGSVYDMNLARGARAALLPKQNIDFNFSRPYIYTPLFKPLRLGDGETYQQELFLAPGDYQIDIVGSLHRQASASLQVQNLHFEQEQSTLIETPIVKIRLVNLFSQKLKLRGENARKIRITLRTEGKKYDSALMVHRFGIRRE